MKHGSSLPQTADNALHSSLSRLRERVGERAAFTPSPAGGRRGWGRCCFLFGRCAWFEAGGRVSARQPSSFSLPRQKKWGKEKASLAGGFPAELPSLLRRSGQTGSRKSDFLCPSTPVLQLACGVAQALCLVLPRLLAGEGWGEGRIHSFPRWGKAGMGAVAASCLGGVLGLRQEVGFRPDSRPHFFCVAKRNEGKKRRALQAACPAELPSLLRRSGQTGSRKSDFFMSKHASLTAGVRVGTSAAPCTPSPACGRGQG